MIKIDKTRTSIDVNKAILDVLETENSWLTFDELYNNVQLDCDWIQFALHLEALVDQGFVQYIFVSGIDVSYYGINKGLAIPLPMQ